MANINGREKEMEKLRMERLIDANDFLQNLIRYKIGRKSLEEIIKAINEQSTAYDVDAVVKQLEESSYTESQTIIRLKNAIDIVKGGGVDV